MKYRVFDYGRRIGSIGVFSIQIVDVEAETPELAAAEWYERFEHGSGSPTVVEYGTLKGTKVRPDFSRKP